MLIAALVTVLCMLLAVPFAFFMARVAPVRLRGVLLAAVLVPLWASYLVKAYAWRAMVQPSGVLDNLGGTPGYGMAVLQNITLDLPFAAALGTASVVIMVLYLLAVRRTGALDNL